jgi:hypothetical protein
VLDAPESCALGGGEIVVHRVVQRTLISLQSKHIIPTLVDDLPGNVALTTHRVDSDDTAMQFQQRQ